MKKIILLFCYSILFNNIVLAEKMEWIYSTENNYWQQGVIQKISKVNLDVTVNICVSDKKLQQVDGFGGCFNELGWDALQSLDKRTKDKVLNNLFGSTGANFSYNRTPIGANDFSRNWYSLNETSRDFKMTNFNIERDKTGLIPYIKAALAINPSFKLWASPWSPPIWMKKTKHYATSSGDHNDFTTDNDIDGDHLIQKPSYLKAYALYLSKYVDAYKKNGIDISMLQFQNEPYTKNQWPNCNWTPQAMANFIGNYLGPEFAKKHPNVELWFGTFNSNKMRDLSYVIRDKKASKYIKGVGLQWEGKEIIKDIRKTYPSIRIMQTESECGNGSNDWEASEYTWSLINHYLKNGANAYIYWNMILDETGLSTWGWKQNSLVSINKHTNQVVYNPEFYLMKHLSHFIQPGAFQLRTSGNEDHLAFINPDNKIIVVVINKENIAKAMRIRVRDVVTEIDLKAKSFNTFIF